MCMCSGVTLHLSPSLPPFARVCVHACGMQVEEEEERGQRERIEEAETFLRALEAGHSEGEGRGQREADVKEKRADNVRIWAALELSGAARTASRRGVGRRGREG